MSGTVNRRVEQPDAVGIGGVDGADRFRVVGAGVAKRAGRAEGLAAEHGAADRPAAHPEGRDFTVEKFHGGHLRLFPGQQSPIRLFLP